MGDARNPQKNGRELAVKQLTVKEISGQHNGVNQLEMDNALKYVYLRISRMQDSGFAVHFTA